MFIGASDPTGSYLQARGRLSHIQGDHTVDSRKSKKFQSLQIDLLEGRIPPASMMMTGLENAAERIEMNMMRMDRENSGLENAAERIAANQQRMMDRQMDDDTDDDDDDMNGGGHHGGGHHGGGHHGGGHHGGGHHGGGHHGGGHHGGGHHGGGHKK
jgi:hypothetical protein